MSTEEQKTEAATARAAHVAALEQELRDCKVRGKKDRVAAIESELAAFRSAPSSSAKGKNTQKRAVEADGVDDQV